MLSAIVAASISFAYQAIVPSAQTLVVHETFSPSEKTINVAKSCGTGYSCAKAGGCQCACPFKAETPERRSRPASMMAATIISDEAARVAAQAVVAATSAEAEKWCVKGGNGGDFFGSEGIQPVVEAALAAAGSSEAVFDAVEAAATAAAGRTNANAARVADAIVVAACLEFGADRPLRRHPITDVALYSSLYAFTKVPFKPVGLVREK